MGPIASAVKDLESAASHYYQDLEAMTEEQLLKSAGGAARAAVDFTYEVAFFTRRIAARFRSEEPEPAPDGDEWMIAPPELQSKAAITSYMKSACEELIEATRAIPEEEGGRLVGTPGREVPAFEMANFAAMHIMYHDAQLNFIQSLSGDLVVHWS